MKNLVFLGSRSVSTKYLRYLIDQSPILGYRVIAAITDNAQEGIVSLCETENIPVMNSLEDYLGLGEVDVAISVQYHLILRQQHLEKARQATLNLHMAPLPEYRGCNQFCFALINQEKTFGTTLHLMNSDIDSGDIVCERRFPIPDECWVNELYDLTDWHSYEMFREFLPRLILGDYTPTPQAVLIPERGTRYYKREDIEAEKRIDLDWPGDRIARHIRATSMPGFPPPYAFLGSHKIQFLRESSDIQQHAP